MKGMLDENGENICRDFCCLWLVEIVYRFKWFQMRDVYNGTWLQLIFHSGRELKRKSFSLFRSKVEHKKNFLIYKVFKSLIKVDKRRNV